MDKDEFKQIKERVKKFEQYYDEPSKIERISYSSGRYLGRFFNTLHKVLSPKLIIVCKVLLRLMSIKIFSLYNVDVSLFVWEFVYFSQNISFVSSSEYRPLFIVKLLIISKFSFMIHSCFRYTIRSSLNHIGHSDSFLHF